METHNGIKTLLAKTRKEWRKWLEKNHRSEKSVWLIIYHKDGPVKTVNYDEAVEEAICFGWIDSIAHKRDKDSKYQFFAQRKPRSNWSKKNRERAEKMMREGLMTPSGQQLVDLARVGTMLEIVAGLEELEWFGSGPHETYPDRKRGGLIGRWRSTVAEQYVPYIRPQENGGHADVRWLRLSDGASRSVRIALDRPGQVSATHFRDADLSTATHDVELAPRAETIIHLDAAHRGLGTASCGPDTLPEYLVGPGSYRWRWTLAG